MSQSNHYSDTYPRQSIPLANITNQVSILQSQDTFSARNENRRRTSHWPPQEDDDLKNLIQQHKEDWETISRFIPTKTPKQCKNRWTKHLDPSLVRGFWHAGEDEDIIRLVGIYGSKSWNLIANNLVGRTGKQCRERWHNHLNPNINKSPWTIDEETAIIGMQKQYGNKWALMTKYLVGRTDNSIKNHWNSTLKKRVAERNTGVNGSMNHNLNDMRAPEFDPCIQFQQPMNYNYGYPMQNNDSYSNTYINSNQSTNNSNDSTLFLTPNSNFVNESNVMNTSFPYRNNNFNFMNQYIDSRTISNSQSVNVYVPNLNTQVQSNNVSVENNTDDYTSNAITTYPNQQKLPCMILHNNSYSGYIPWANNPVSGTQNNTPRILSYQNMNYYLNYLQPIPLRSLNSQFNTHILPTTNDRIVYSTDMDGKMGDNVVNMFPSRQLKTMPSDNNHSNIYYKEDTHNQ